MQIGAIAVGYGQSTLSERFPTQWTYFQGALFIFVILLLPGGIASLWPKIKALFARKSGSSDSSATKATKPIAAEAGVPA